MFTFKGVGVSDVTGSTRFSLHLSLYPFFTTAFPEKNEAVLLQKGQVLASGPCSQVTWL